MGGYQIAFYIGCRKTKKIREIIKKLKKERERVPSFFIVNNFNSIKKILT